MPDKLVYLMRGLPACGKSHMAQRLVGDAGIILETDQFFVRQNSAGAMIFDYREEQLAAAREWIFKRFQQAIAEGRSPIALDRGNGRNAVTRRFAQYAVEHGYVVELKEPDSDWWLEIKRLMRDRPQTNPQLAEWATRLAEMSRATHRVPLDTIQNWMDAWYPDLTVEDILNNGCAAEAR